MKQTRQVKDPRYAQSEVIQLLDVLTMWLLLGNICLLGIVDESKLEEWLKFGVTTKRRIFRILSDRPVGRKVPRS